MLLLDCDLGVGVISVEVEGACTIDLVAKALISLIARGARFLNETPWSCKFPLAIPLYPICLPAHSTYSLVQVDGVFARNDISDGGSGGLGRGLLGRLRRHFWERLGIGRGYGMMIESPVDLWAEWTYWRWWRDLSMMVLSLTLEIKSKMVVCDSKREN